MRFARLTGRAGGLALAFGLVLGLSAQTKAAVTLDWKGQTWTVTGAGTAVVDSNENAVLTSSALTAGDLFLHINRVSPDINGSGTPWVQFSYIENGTNWTDILIDDEVTAGNPRVQAGTLYGAAGLGQARFTDAGTQETTTPFGTALASAGTAHTLFIGKLGDGTIAYQFDGIDYSTSWLKDQFGSNFNFNDIYLRLRKGTNGQTVTFTDFQFGDDAPAFLAPEPSTLALAASGLLVLGYRHRRRSRAAERTRG